ncbi:MAG TPA: signal recognition particle protein Srp19 [Euryarchaeota archaeon]|nr:signal recognition particle protein Srp19 [Euryarchaeota archaeon]
MIIYPSNIDSTLTKKMGRKISRKQAVPNPLVKEVYKAVKVLGEGDARLEATACYPRNPVGHEGRVVLDRKGGKTSLMKRVSKEVKRMRTPSS